MWNNYLFMETPDDYLVSLDAKTGRERWHKPIADLAQGYFSTPAPIVVGNHVIAGTGNVFTLIAVFFSKMALVTFGGAYAVLAYVAQQAVTTYHWVSPGEMLDGLGMAETTPGPLIMVLQFVGFMAAFRAPGLFSPLLAATR